MGSDNICGMKVSMSIIGRLINSLISMSPSYHFQFLFTLLSISALFSSNGILHWRCHKALDCSPRERECTYIKVAIDIQKLQPCLYSSFILDDEEGCVTGPRKKGAVNWIALRLVMEFWT